ncbi:hypothetical protein GWO43_30170 [candidate division KSB1 bacterium]|nr:hypothetical protein [candidate division KSB1 bacterium]NIT75049.1 hypothetical protein [candidate division KSB1 bacterium]NIX74729.1 hypothetical protein [candidate division KSB1 bacterium]
MNFILNHVSDQKTLMHFLLSVSILMTALLLNCGKSALEPSAEVTGVKINLFAKTVKSSNPTPGSVDSVKVLAASLVIGSVKLESAGVDSTQDFSSKRSQIIDLNLQQLAVAVDTIEVPPGTYKEVEISIDKLEPGNPDEEPLIANRPEFSNASMIIQGLVFINGSDETFTFKTDLDRDMEIELAPFLTILPTTGDTSPPGTRVAIVVDIGQWFVSDVGIWLDPREDANKSVIESNIQSSLEAFEDSNENGIVD